MDCKTGAEHVASLRDGRAVYIDGERVSDVTTHPAFRNAVRSAAALYDFQSRPENLERMTFAPIGAYPGGRRRINVILHAERVKNKNYIRCLKTRWLTLDRSRTA